MDYSYYLSDGAEALEALRRNRPDETAIQIELSDEPSVELAPALEQNHFITDIAIIFSADVRDDETRAANNWTELLRVMATRNILRKVSVSADNAEDVDQSDSAVLFLEAIQQNPAVQSVSLYSLGFSADSFATFLNTASSPTSLKIMQCTIVQRSNRGESGEWNRLVGDAFRRNTSIQTLELAYLDDSFMLPILQSLRAVNGTLRTLIFKMYYGYVLNPEISSLMQNILESTTSIQRFELAGSYSGSTFGPLALGLIASTSVSDIKFGFCRFVDGGSIHLQNIIRNKTNLTCLSVTYYSSFWSSGGMEALVQALSSPNSPLRSFEFRFGILGSIPAGQFRNLLRAIERSKLKHVSIHVGHQAPQLLGALIQSIPAMKVTELGLSTDFHLARDTTHDLLQAFKRNYRLQQVQHDFEFNAAEQSRLDLYLERNKRLAHWVENPATVPQHLWPDATKLALEDGESSLFASLRTVLGSDYASLVSGKRKRKRPQFYEA